MPWLPLLPPLALIGGSAAGIACHAWLPAALAALLSAWLATLLAWCTGRSTQLVTAALVASAAGGVALGHDADLAARHPALLARVVASAGSPVVLEGRLRRDAAETASGVSLRLDVDGVGVAVTVGGQLAGSRVEHWRAGRLLRLPAQLRVPASYWNPGVPDHALALARRGIALLGSVKSGALVDVAAVGSRPAEWAAGLRRAVRERLRRHVGRWSERSAGVAIAVLIGDRAGLPDEDERRLQAAGTYHVLAISGGNIVILAALAAIGLRLLAVPARARAGLTIAALALYAAVAEGGASVARATVMASVYLALTMADQRAHVLNAIALAAGLVVAAEPLALADPGFALSFGATVAIVMAVDSLRGRLSASGWLRVPAGVAIASAAAEIALAPVGAWYFSRVTLAGLVANFVAVPAMSVVQVSALAVVAAPLDGLARPAALVTHLAAEGLLRSADVVDWAPWLSWRVPRPAVATVVGYYACLAVWRVRPRLWLPFAAVACWLVVPPTWLERWGPAPGRLRVTFLDVGQGDSILAELPGGRSLLVDAGGSFQPGAFDIGERVVSPAVWARGVGRLGALAVTHGDPDHAGGVPRVVDDLDPREVWEGVPVPRHPLLARIAGAAVRAGATPRSIGRGYRAQLGGVDLQVWHPGVPDWERRVVRNDDSLVVELRYGRVSVLLAGDIGRDVERELAGLVPPAPLRVMQVPHHGSRTSSSERFLEALAPAAAVVSCGRRNRFGHPAPEVIARYQARGVELFRTDQDGAVTVETDGRTLAVSTFTGRTRAW